ncbi:hypothetical protein T459_32120 [Capsicum annuum]|uniref:Uncharacterized protein n=2 Tax=Capsicum annuum TaxID=4072 RepID=A0A2G2Y2T2_CAPAN|nr:hypothetical protein T459_32120 [Capsicum annuum]
MPFFPVPRDNRKQSSHLHKIGIQYLEIPTYMEKQLQESEEEKKEKCTRKLDFSAPLLSTRRSSEKSLSCSNIPPQLSIDIFNRVPFSWEQRPGKPKEMGVTNIEIVPPPKLPPCMWHTRKDQLATSTTTTTNKSYDGDIDNDDHDNYVGNIDNQDVYSDALDVFSLGDESIDMLDGTENRKSNMEVDDEEPNCDWNANKPAVPNFIIQRFLKDAKELAISSALENTRKRILEDEQNERRPCNFSSKAVSCGFDMFIPWRIKPKPCCVKNSVVAASPRMRPQWTNRDKYASDADSKF